MLSISSDVYRLVSLSVCTPKWVPGALGPWVWALALAILCPAGLHAQTQTPAPAVVGGVVAAQPAAPPPRILSEARSAQNAVEQTRRLLVEKKPDLALQQLEQGLKMHPRDPQLRFLYATVLNDQGRSQEALDVFVQLTEDFPELPEPHNNVAVLFAARGELDRARAALENAVRALPSYTLGHENLGDVYLRMAARSYELAQLADRNNQSATTKLRLSRALLERVLSPTP
jgi:tetratricopeptide (TPR) repeat protein